jgi:hypothetical protein
MDRKEYIELYQKWWEKLPNKEFKLILENYPEGFNWYWFGWTSEMKDIILSRIEIIITSKEELKEWNRNFVGNKKWTYPFQCFTVKNNLLNYIYGI